MMIRKPAPGVTHVDDFIDGHFLQDCYARWVLNLLRMPACLQIDFKPWISQYKLFCVYQGEWYRVTVASRLGDIGLSRDFEADCGYTVRVDVSQCSDWSPKPPEVQLLEPEVKLLEAGAP